MTEEKLPQKVNLLGFDAEGLKKFCEDLGEKPFRAKQLERWIHRRGARDFSEMTDLAKSFRAKLEKVAEIRGPEIIRDKTAADGTRKWLLDVGNGNAVEMVYIPQDGRGTLCVSSQAGCAMNCLFCSTGKQGFNRNLKASEIIGQLWHAEHTLRKDLGITDENERVISNVVMMGMGEPLQNLDAVIPSLKLMLDDNAYGLSRRRVTVSTSGLVRQMDKLAEQCPIVLAVSLHAPNNELRDKIMPINRKHPLEQLLAACKRYLEHAPRDFITFEYILIGGVNDSLAQAKELITLVQDIPCKFNLIPFNPFPGSGLERSKPEAVKAFADRLNGAGIVTTVRKVRGDDIDAACGQLAGEIKDRTKLAEKRANREIIIKEISKSPAKATGGEKNV